MACKTLSREMQPADLLDPSRCEMIWTHLRDPLDGYLVHPPRISIDHTVDGRYPAPVDMVNIPLFTRFYTSQVFNEKIGEELSTIN